MSPGNPGGIFLFKREDMKRNNLPGVRITIWLLGIVFFLPGFSQRLEWSELDENQAEFGFIGYKGARKNVTIDGSGNIISCAPFGNQVYVGANVHNAAFETLIVKRSPDGQVIWSRTLNGTGFKSGHSIHADSVGNIYVLGWYYGNSSIQGTNLYSYGNYDCFVVKLNAAGQIIYTRTFGGSGYDYPIAITSDPDGHAYIAGRLSLTLQCGPMTLVTMSASSHFLLCLDATGSPVYLRNVCQKAGTDWGKGDLSRSYQGKLAMVSTYLNNSGFQGFSLNGSGGYLAIIDETNGDIEHVVKAGAEAWVVDHEPGGNVVVLGLQQSSTDSVGGNELPVLNTANQLFLARVSGNGVTSRIRVMPKINGNYQNNEGIRGLHISQAGELFLSGEMTSPFLASPNKTVNMNLAHNSSKPQAVLFKMNEQFECLWFVGVGSVDTLAQPNSNLGCGVYTDPLGNIVWCTMNEANSVVRSKLLLNNDTFITDSLRSRFEAYGIHYWKFSEPFIRTLDPTNNAYCPGDTLTANFVKNGIFNQGNRFYLELSDSVGSFEYPLVLDSLQDTGVVTLKGAIPLFQTPSGQYRYRVRSDNPAVYGSISSLPIEVRGKPNADAGPDFLFCLGDTVYIEGSGGGSYRWEPHAGSIQTDSAMLITLPNNHSTYILRVTDSVSTCINYDTVSIQYRQAVKLKPMNDSLLCAGQRAVFYGGILEGDTSRAAYTWLDSSGNILAQADSLVLFANNPQRITLIAWDSCSILRDTLHFHTSIRDPLSIRVTPDTLLCFNSQSQITATASGGEQSGYRFLWYDAQSNALRKVGATMDTLLTDSLRLRVKVEDGCSAVPDSSEVLLRVSQIPAVDLPDTVFACYGDSIYLHATTSGGYPAPFNYSWKSGPYGTSDSFLIVASANETVGLRVRDACGILASTKTLLQVRVPKNIQIRQDTLVCVGEQVLIYASGAEQDTGQYGFYWEGDTLSSNYFYRTFYEDQVLHLRIVDQCDESEQLDSVRIDVRDSLRLQLPLDTPYCYGETVNLQAQASGGLPAGYDFVWKDPADNILSSTSDIQFRITTVTDLRLFLEDGCSVFGDSLSLQLKPGPELKIAPQSDTTLCYDEIFRFTPWITEGNGGPYGYTSSPHDSAALYNGIVAQSDEIIRIIAHDGCSDDDTIEFRIDVLDPIQVIFPNDTQVCQGVSMDLQPQVSGGLTDSIRYYWNGVESQLNQQLLLERDTSLEFCVRDGCSQDYCDSLYVGVYPLQSALFDLLDSPLCVPGNIRMQVRFPSAGSVYHWTISPGTSDSLTSDPDFEYVLTAPGNYLLELFVEDANGCISPTETEAGRAYPYPSALFTLSDTVPKIEQTLEIHVADQSVVQLQWSLDGIDSVGVQNYLWMSEDTGHFELELIGANRWGCYDTFMMPFRVRYPMNCFVPNAFSPFGLESNREFRPVCESVYESELIIYNRWGEIIFRTNDPEGSWDGKDPKTGEYFQSGVYLYLFRARDGFGEIFQQSGTVTLLL